MVTRPFKALFLSLLSAAVVATPIVVAVPAHANGCALPGAGTEADPWQVDSQADFQLVGASPTECTASGHYLQTANLTLNDPANDYRSNFFSGTYDGDHYTIDLADWISASSATPTYLFNRLDSGGEILKVRLTGSITFSGTQSFAAPLVGRIMPGAVVSEVHSAVDISSTRDDLEIGGIAWKLDEGARIQYSTFSGAISWTPTNPTNETEIGGIVSIIGAGGTPTAWAEIRDSYASGSITFPSSASQVANIGGITGLTSGSDGKGRIVRSYSAVDISAGDRVGGLIGRQSFTDANLQVVSSFWLESATVTKAVGLGTAAVDYLGTDPYLPLAPGVDSTELATLTTFTSQEASPAGSGNPGGTEIVPAASDESGTPSSPDYRWAIEAGNVGVFIPSLYDDGDSNTSTDYFETTNRDLYADTSVARTYQARGSIVEGTATGYPSLGRVWEICSQENSGFPVLVWEERCGELGGGSSGGGGSSSGGNDRDDTVVVAAEVPTLAATGTPVVFGQLGLAVVALFFGLGAILVGLRKRVSSGR